MLMQMMYAASLIPPAFILDDFPGAPLAYSFRKLRNDYTGDCCAVKRTSGDNLIIGFVPDGNGYMVVDADAITAFCGTGIGTIRILYNQGTLGPAGDLGGGGTPQSPIIYNNGMLLNFGRAYMDFTTSQMRSIFVNFSPGINAQESSIFTRINTINANGTSRRVFALFADTFTNMSIISVATSGGDITVAQRYPEPQIGATSPGNPLTNHTLYNRKIASGMSVGIDGSALIFNNTPTFNGSVGSLRLGGSESGTSGTEFNGHMQEWIFYDTDQNANRFGVESNMNQFYTGL